MNVHERVEMLLKHRGSSALELEAADYFKLDLGQVYLFNQRSNAVGSSASRDNGCVCQPTKMISATLKQPPAGPKCRQLSSVKHRCNSKKKKQPPPVTNLGVFKSPKPDDSRSKQAKASRNREYLETDITKRRGQILDNGTGFNKGRQQSSSVSEPPSEPILASLDHLACSSTTSTNSLPSIYSSPSLSPSLICPHLSLDDILSLRLRSNGSPHTIGLCSKCRLDPPPNIQSPLSPIFKPSSTLGESTSKTTTSYTHNDMQSSQMSSLRRVVSDHGPQGSRPLVANKSTAQSSRNLAKLPQTQTRNDSLEYYVEPKDLRRSQMSPTLRNSVEYIRNNSIESGRVLKIYKNSQPHDKPLRVSILRNEFATLNNLLDFIGGRQLIPCGARYLFHLDGQLVYSVHELKHDSAYIVSGSRQFDFRANNILKEQLSRCKQHALVGAKQATKNEKILAQKTSCTQLDRGVDKAANLDKSNSAAAERCEANENVAAKLVEVGATLSEPRGLIAADCGAGGGIQLEKRAQESSGKVSRKPNPSQPQQVIHERLLRQRSNINATKRETNLQDEQLREATYNIHLTRAKSELSAIPSKRKKNVTFMDTGRGSSPAISDLSTGDKVASSFSQQPEQTEQIAHSQQLNGELDSSTNGIGIQVSDSIKGFLIDLPLPLPAKGDDSNLRQNNNKTPVRKRPMKFGPQLDRRQASSSNASQRQKATASKRPQELAKSQKAKQIVTITERQLSLEEYNKFVDLDKGDHHNELHEAQVNRENQLQSAGLEEEKRERESKPVEDTQRLTMATTSSLDEDCWQYPGGRASSATPTERPVSQNEPSESVRARVTTPTPSLSNGGDSNSLSMSYELSTSTTPTPSPRRIRSQSAELQQSGSCSVLKQRLDVKGKLFAGIFPPTKNFKLLWVNGFSINDLYPENSANSLMSSGEAIDRQQASNVDKQATRLTPATNQKVLQQVQFKPSERFNNWLCKSRKYNELIYPVGCIIVLWCKSTDEQRYYSKHTSSISSVALAALDLNLAASAQICDSNERPEVGASIHLWSLKSLDTLLVISDDELRNKRIFSLRLRNSPSSGCELSVGARDERHLFLLSFSNIKLDDQQASPRDHLEGGAELALETERVAPSKQVRTERKQHSSFSANRVSKVLRANQVPLLVLPLTNVCQQDNVVSKTPSQRKNGNEILLSFGVRKFNIWIADKRRQKLLPIQPEGKNVKFVELITNATCLTRLSPHEFLIGDSIGNVSLLAIKIVDQQSKVSEQKYNVDTVSLLKPILEGQEETKRASAITCLARVSGNIFVSADSTCTVRFYKLIYSKQRETPAISCQQLSCISLPTDLGFVCSIILADYHRSQSIVDFYVASTSNTILFGSVQLQTGRSDRESHKQDILNKSYLSIVCEGHETCASNLVTDYPSFDDPKNKETENIGLARERQFYFTCSLDYRICKWNGRRLVWRSMLPSACASLAVHPTGFVLAVGSIDGTVYILDKESGLLISYFPLTPIRINCLAYSKDGALLAAGCSNGSIFILPVYDRGLKYKKVSIFQSPNAVVSLQFSVDNQFMLTSVTHGSYQELVLWDLPNFRYMRENVKLAADKIKWFDSICSGSEDVRAIWENANLVDSRQVVKAERSALVNGQSLRVATIVNLSCHRLVRDEQRVTTITGDEPSEKNFVIASDTRGYLRLFRYPSYDIQQGFYAIRLGSSAVNCCRFLSSEEPRFVSASLDGGLCLWALE